ncbi:GNAT family N-acetyltransferase [Xaviernesmea oryzae]|uniref:GNAT family N-acetyltransferase n=1 Tax=Xaviernesmea oryzae TaxID=464029 RepID=A0A1Q9AZG0_9HYPH|nr:GNAT family N-acetyltransferase [Xaviernesmea oryzae]OLP61081.1 GNAT family N-acetyltransferase [Xaviernesmea oryzae]SEL14083.1 Ribosomal protein S18 acetylase RimI [Xaviernesmea oryzae]
MIEIRPLADEDFQSWLPLWKGYQTFYKVEIAEAVTRQTWQRLNDPDEPMGGALALVGGLAAGLVHFIMHRSCWTTGDYCYPQDLFVDPAFRKQGLGIKLIEHVFEVAERAACSRVYWLTQSSNATAMELYDKLAQRTDFVQYRKLLP